MVYYTCDIHGNILPLLNFIRQFEMTGDDTIVVLGDAGLNYYGNSKGDKRAKYRLNDRGVKILCIHGNHEMRPATIPTYKEKEWNGGIVYVEDDYPNLMFAKAGEIYDLDGYKSIAIGGAYSVDKFYRLNRGLAWFDDEQPSDTIKARVEKNLERVGWKVDHVLSHTCPFKYIPTEAFLPGLNQALVDQSTEKWLDTIEDRLDYTRWYCGHWHIDKHIDKMHFHMVCLESVVRED